MQLLIVEDDAKTAEFVKRGFTEAGWQCVIAGDGDTGLSYARNTPFDAIVTDIMLPGLDGIALLKRLRAEGVRTPAIVLSARDSVEAKIQGLEAGGDDYLSKPFSIAELVTRVQTVLRRAFPDAMSAPTVLKAADLEMDVSTHRVSRAGERIHLQRLEYQLLEYLLRNRGRVVTKSTIMQHVWDFDMGTFTNVVEACVCRLRDKVDKNAAVKLIHTVRGFGYVLEER